tara:strand:- start:122401 stop:123156 length:756 start_codon:yes stop_codon:yes gene_type:complete
MNSYKVYYINLDKSVERRTFMEQQFQEFGIPIERYSAILGKAMDAKLLKKLKGHFNILTHFPYLNPGEIGLTATYFKLWKEIQNQDEKFAVILEDDALIQNDFFSKINDIFSEVSPNDFVDISGRKGYFKLKEKDFTTLYSIPPLQTTGQIVGKNAAAKLVANFKKWYAPIDVLKQDVFKHRVRVYVTNEVYVVSNDKNLGGTTLQQKKMPKLKKIIREIVRPFWQLLTLFTYKSMRLTRNYFFYKGEKIA